MRVMTNDAKEKKIPIMTTLDEIQMEYDSATDYHAIVKHVFEEKGIPDVLEKVEKVIDSMAEPFDHNKAFFEMQKNDIDLMAAYIKSTSERQLVADIKNVFGV